ncbi:hypothetical protein DSO57_1035493 [Entomophthora muscae]|uniref:Uncharacterized protein n=1 Tax=Entomophthora muscae TaxID=34485 RepID=A0ACC2TAH4_9FUNG|nr:hypothetical protein DSO57_1035493 [Entomophthora muscae]
MKLFASVFFFVGFSAVEANGGQQSAAVNGLHHLRQLISQVDEANAQGKVGRTQYQLPLPRPQYNLGPGELEYFLQHSLIAGCDSQTIEANRCFCQDKFVMASVFLNTTMDAQAVVAVDPRNKLVVVSYRATVSQINWDTNEDYQLVSYPNIGGNTMVHQGHLRHLLSIHYQMEPHVLQYLSDPRFSGYTLHLTGYSLGASVAAISLPIWQNALASHGFNNRIQMFTYSGSRPGNLEFALHLESMHIPIIRYAKKGDVVPHVPDQNMGYSQVGQEYYDDGSLGMRHDPVKCSPILMEDINCSLGDTRFRPLNHVTPFQNQRMNPPYC